MLRSSMALTLATAHSVSASSSPADSRVSPASELSATPHTCFNSLSMASMGFRSLFHFSAAIHHVALGLCCGVELDRQARFVSRGCRGGVDARYEQQRFSEEHLALGVIFDQRAKPAHEIGK